MHSEYQLVGIQYILTTTTNGSNIVLLSTVHSTDLHAGIHIPDPEDSFHKRCCIYPALV